MRYFAEGDVPLGELMPEMNAPAARGWGIKIYNKAAIYPIIQSAAQDYCSFVIDAGIRSFGKGTVRIHDFGESETIR
ncbi:MAG: hypothetical protein JSW39_08790 [Desulfobacterales bacterium]|nr:MAG: hypothetical protein JSW39_08790 [Desulfobacterales bacterium]